jgi:hypothetical protein
MGDTSLSDVYLLTSYDRLAAQSGGVVAQYAHKTARATAGDHHAVKTAHINGLMPNVAAFAQAFGKAGDPMDLSPTSLSPSGSHELLGRGPIPKNHGVMTVPTTSRRARRSPRQEGITSLTGNRLARYGVFLRATKYD